MRFNVMAFVVCSLTSFTLTKQDYWLTIFVHGSVGLRPSLAVNTLMHLITDQIEESPYRKTVEAIRADHFFYKNQAIQQIGLLPIHTLNGNYENSAAQLFADLYNYVQQEVNPEQTNIYYTYGWSGLISHKARYKDARIFYEKLREELNELKKRHITPKIRIVAYSHGGNIGLLLGRIREELYPNDTFEINELVLIGTPIQSQTDFLVCNPIFIKVYNIYSRGDCIQPLDCFSPYRFFSRRRFKSCGRYNVPRKVIQIEIKIKAPGNKPANLRKWHDRSPGHLELWTFGWPIDTHSFYRTYFPLTPLPTGIFAPLFTDIADDCDDLGSQIVLEWYPAIGKMEVRARRSYKRYCIDFLDAEQLATMKHYAYEHQPPSYTHVVAECRTCEVVRQANDRKIIRKKRTSPCFQA